MMIGICDFCGKQKQVRKVRHCGSMKCLSCYFGIRRKTKKIGCSSCGRSVYSPHRSKNGSNICVSCYTKENSCCKICGNLGIFRYGKCENCHINNLKLYRNCEDCGQCYAYKVSSVTRCKTCTSKFYRRESVGSCIKCHKLRYVSKSTEQGPICTYCYKKFYSPKRECSICGKKAISFFNKKEQKVLCIPCAEKIRKGKSNT
jgi:hypothetical protein